MVRENTPYIGLIKPDLSDQYSIKDFNDNSDTIDSRFQLVENDAQTKANTGLTNLSESGQAILDNKLNKNQITNCILEAPNGVLALSSDNKTILIHNGLKFLCPNGRNADGTMKNIEVTLTRDYTVLVQSFWTNPFVLFILPTEEPRFGVASAYAVQASDIGSTNYDGFWYNPTENKMYEQHSADNIRSERPAVFLGRIYHNNGVVTALTPDDSQETTPYILKRSDCNIISSYGFPSTFSTTLSVGASGTTYIAPANGYFFACTTNTASNVNYTYFHNITTGLSSYAMADARVRANLNIYANRGDVVKLEYYSSIVDKLVFCYANGEVR